MTFFKLGLLKNKTFPEAQVVCKGKVNALLALESFSSYHCVLLHARSIFTSESKLNFLVVGQ